MSFSSQATRDEVYVDQFLMNYLPKLVLKPCSPQVLKMIPQFCSAAKKVGKAMDVDPLKEKFDRMQMVFNEFCKDVTIDVALRLQVLEVLELRIMNWVVRPELTEFYQTGIAKLEENKKMQQAQAIVDDGSVKSASTISTAFLEKPNRQKSYPVGDDMRFKTSVQELFPDVKLKERECVIVDGGGALMKRIAELDGNVVADRLMVKKKELQKLKSIDRRPRNEECTQMKEIEAELIKLKFSLIQRFKDLEKKNKELVDTMEKEMNELDSVISALFEELDEMKMKNQELEEVLKCPVCLDTCRPPLQIYQCHEGHIVCESCISRPELVTCPQCRMSLDGNVSRSRVLEEMAMRLFPPQKKRTAEASQTTFHQNQGRNRRSP